MKVEVWADLVCPWCYLGKRRFDKALEQHGRPVEVEIDAIHGRLTQLGADDGVEFHFEKARPGNSLDAHRVLQLAKKRGLADGLQERLYRGYFSEGRSLADRETLLQLASEVGLDAEPALVGDAYFVEVRADAQRAASLWFHGVPAFLIDERLALYGAQPVETMVAALARAA